MYSYFSFYSAMAEVGGTCSVKNRCLSQSRSRIKASCTGRMSQSFRYLGSDIGSGDVQRREKVSEEVALRQCQC